MIIFCATRSYNFEIWLWIYICQVSNSQWPNLLIVEYLYPMIFSDIAPPDRSKCAIILSGSIPLPWSFRDLYDVLNARTISPFVTAVHETFRHTSHSILSSVPQLLRIWCTLRDMDVTPPLVPVD